MKRYQYVGPEAIRVHAQRQPPGAAMRAPEQLRDWLRAMEPGARGRVTATYIISVEGILHLADRHSEHVACSGGREVLSAGEITFGWRGDEVEVLTVSNLSTGFCPEPESWPAVAAALAPLDVEGVGGWTDAFDFRRCPGCGQRNVVKDDWFVCGVCDASLPERWNFVD